VHEVPLVVVTDSSFRDLPGWRTLVEGAVEEATSDLPEAVGLAFEPSAERTWEPEGTYPSLGAALDSARIAIGPAGGIVAILVARRLTGGPDPEEGYAYLGEPAFLVCDPQLVRLGSTSLRRRRLATLFRHELGHVYGIPHLSGNNVMNPSPDRRSSEFGDLGWDILRANRTMELGAPGPFTGSDLTTLRDVYLLLTQRGEMETSLLVNLAVAFEREGEPAEAVPLYEMALARGCEPRVGNLGLARASLAMGDSSRARSLAAEMTAQADGSPGLARGLGTLWLRLGEYDAAEAEFTLAIETGSDSYYARFQRGLARFRAGRYGDAVVDFEAALEIEPTPDAWFNLALARDADGDRAGGVQAMESCLDLEPEADLRDAAERYLRAWSEGPKDPGGG